MNYKERIKATFDHTQPDKIPVDFGACCCSMINVGVISELRDYYGLEKKPPKVQDGSAMIGFMEPDLVEAMGIDCEQLWSFSDTYGLRHDRGWKEWTYRGYTVLFPEETIIREDGKGGYYIYPQGNDANGPAGHMPEGGYYFDNLTRFEYDEDNMNPDDNLEDYGIPSDDAIKWHHKVMDDIKTRGHAVVAAPVYAGLGDANFIQGPQLVYPKGIRDVAEWYMAPVLYPEYVHEVYDRGTDITIKGLEKYWKEFGSDIDVVQLCGTDLAGQDGLLFSLDTIDEFYMPYYKKVNDWIHSHTTWKTLKHDCGAIYDIMGRFIDVGFDAVNPVQCSAKGMDPQRLKNEFGKDIVFWGGGCNTQKTLQFGTPEEVREEVLQRLDIFGKDGGYVFNCVHDIQAMTPVENVVAMVDAYKDFNGDK